MFLKKLFWLLAQYCFCVNSFVRVLYEDRILGLLFTFKFLEVSQAKVYVTAKLGYDDYDFCVCANKFGSSLHLCNIKVVKYVYFCD